MDLEKKTRALLKSQRRIDPRAIDRKLIATAALLDKAPKLFRESKKQSDVKLRALLAAQMQTERKWNLLFGHG